MYLNTNLVLDAIPAYIALIIIEAVYFAKEQRYSLFKRHIFTSWCLGLGFVILSPFTKSVMLFTYSVAFNYHLFNFTQTAWYAVLLCFFADDITYYWFHRLNHKIRFLWASHSVHHSADVFSLSANFRQPWTGHILSGNFLFWIWMPLLGFSPALMLFIKSLNAIYQFFLHTETIDKLPRWYEYFFNTPSHHRVHHGSDIEYLDKNHGGTLIIWDRLFGTYKEEKHRPKYGLSSKINSNNPFVITFFEWQNIMTDLRRSGNIRDGFNFLFNAPGWSPDGSSKTVRELQQVKR